jgi:hypothetical protein
MAPIGGAATGGVLGATTDTSGGTRLDDGTNQQSNNPGSSFDMMAYLQGIKDDRVKEAQGYYDTAKSYFDEMMGLLGGKRGQFNQMYDEGQGQIASTFETEKGNARRTAQDLESVEGNRARALGLGGSATDYAAARRNENLARTMGQTNQVRSANEMENKRLRDTRMDWATGEEAGLNRYLGDANTQMGALRNRAVEDFSGDAGSYLDSILQNQLLANTAKLQGGISGYDASPYSVDTSQLQSYLEPTLSSMGMLNTGNQAAGGANPVSPTNILASLYDPKKKNPLYAGLS